MKTLWAPWRLAFITEERSGECIFCKKPAENDDKKNYIYERRNLVFGLLNRFPYNSGHLMIAPYRHIISFEELRDEEWTAMLKLLQDTTAVLNKLMRPEGFNVGFNIGRASGAGFEHLHLHVVPRWSGDTNFMPVLSDTKVLPEHLDETFRRIREDFRDLRG
ncbi:MAG: HIT domain-containing protein [Candidatus Verstraetearchaeota archaeon]|nr:HIT domain-containing protein [Candidatus Verstraetearchaeota archaeon]